jgi:hypothetical protein
MLAIRNLELHVTHACNLGCESCSHYSNHGHKGMLSLDDARAWMQGFSRRLAPKQFSLLGGEPTVHPRLTDFVLLAREQWPGTHIRLVTNGFFLHRHPGLGAAIGRDPDARIYLSIHHESPEYQQALSPAWKTLHQWQKDHGVQVQVYRSHGHWTRRYHGHGSDMPPFTDARPRDSWKRCPARYCPQLFEGHIWKCAPLAYLPMQQEKFGIGEAWSPYLKYRPPSPDNSDEELSAFFAREEEPECGMCPAEPQTFALPLPLPRRRVVPIAG